MFHFFALVIPNSCSLTLKSSAVKALRLRFDFCPLWPVDTPASVFEFWNLNPQGEMVVEDSFVTVQFREDQESHQSSLINVLTAWKESKATAKGCVDGVFCSTFNGALPFFIQKKKKKKKTNPHLFIATSSGGKRARLNRRSIPAVHPLSDGGETPSRGGACWAPPRLGERAEGWEDYRGGERKGLRLDLNLLFFFWTDWGKTRRVWFGISGCAFVQISKSSKRTLRARQTDNVGGPPACRRGRDAVCSVTVCSCVRSELVNGVWKNRTCLCLHLHIFFFYLWIL